MNTFALGFIVSLLVGSGSATPVDLLSKVPLREHVPAALPFHCVSGDESLGCAARPATPARGDDQ